MNSEWEIDVSTMRGVMIGLEFPPPDARPDDVKFAMVLDLGIVRIVVVRWTLED